MKKGDKVRHKEKEHRYKGIGEVVLVSQKGLAFVKWPNAEISTLPAYYKLSSLELVDGESHAIKRRRPL